MENYEITKEVDTRGMACPLPILKAKRALTEVSSGDVVRIVATDPASVRDFQIFARQTGNDLIDQSNRGEEYIHVLRRR